MFRNPDLDDAWAAGFFDGDGCVQINTAGKYFHVTLSAHQKHPKPLYKLQELYGGPVYKEKNGLWVWQVKAAKSIKALTRITPHSVMKKDQLELARAFQFRRGVRPYDRAADLRDFHKMRDIRKEIRYGKEDYEPGN